jgi:putative aminopeptidase FrvX
MTPLDSQAVFQLTRPIWEEPTAPFHEAGMRRVIHDLLAPLPHVSVEQDEFGNLIARYRHGARPARWAFAAHMDHPGWVRPPGGRPGEWTFLGGVPETVRESHKTMIREFGDFAMWDLPVTEVRDGILHARACDDQGGCAAIVAMFHELERLGAEAEVYGFFTRAEEVGFVGAIQLARSGTFQEPRLTVVSLETSAERAPARIGAGPIVRVGDKTSLFDTRATEEILQIARDSGITVQRCLMAGGTCEATAFQLYGLTSAGLCVALGNYHNVTPDGRIGAEYISLDDLAGLVALCREIALRTEPAGRTRVAELLKARLEKEIEEFRPYYARADV